MRPLGAALLACACAAKPAGEGSGTSSSSGTSESTTTAVAELGGDPSLEHGVVQLRFVSGVGTSDFYAGTAQLQLTMHYAECLTAFYAGNPDYTLDGPLGEAVFGGVALGGEAWLDRLCTIELDAPVACEVVSFEQQLGPSTLTVRYAVTDELLDRRVAFGPLPKAELAACAGGELPLVRIQATSDVVGLDANGQPLWVLATFQPGEAVTDQGTPILVSAGSP